MSCSATGQIEFNTPLGPLSVHGFAYIHFRCALHAFIACDALTIQQAVRIALMSRRAVRHGWTFSHMFCPDWRVLLSPHELLGLPP